MSRLLWPCFALSGAAALALELLWIRSAGLVLGNTAATAGTVVTCYFAGLALGGFLGRQPARRPVRRYALLELAVGLGAVVSCALFRTLTSDGAQAMLAAAGTSGRVAIVALLIVPVTVALGATLPTLAQVLAAPASVGPRAGALYALNTLGGAIGIAVMGFGLPSLIGVTASYLCTAATSVVAGLVALVITRSTTASQGEAGAPKDALGWLWMPAAATGFAGMTLEILWVVLFAQVLHNSVYSFAAVSLVFLLALAAGAAISALLLRRQAPRQVAAAGLLVAGVTTIAGVWLFVRATDGLQYVGMNSGLGEYLVRILGLATIAAGPGTLAAGAVLPALWAARGDSVSRSVGELSGANLLGGAAGASAAGFVIVPLLGLRAGFLLAAAVLLIVSAALAHGRVRAFAYAGLLAAVILDPMHLPLSHLKAGETLRAIAEGAAGIVTVVDTADDRQLRLDNFYLLGGSTAERNERRLGLVPLLLHPEPRRVLFVGLATGISASAASAVGVPLITVVEVVPEVATLARRHFSRWNGDLLGRPEVRLVVDDGRRYLAGTRETFDVIVSDLFIPWHASAGGLYSLEMFRTAARRLAPGGLFCQWLPMYQLTREEFEIIAWTFTSAFPHATLWRNDFYPDRPVLGLIGTTTSVAVDVERIGRRLAGLPPWGRDSFLGAPRSIGMLYVADLSAVSQRLARAPLNLDDHPVLEFLAPRLTRMNAQGDKDWLTGVALAEYTENLSKRPGQAPDSIVPGTREMDEARRAGLALFRYAIAAMSGHGAEAERLMGEIGRLVPDVIAGVEGEAPAAQIAQVQRNLGHLESEQERLRQQLQSIEQRLGARSTGGDRR